VPDAQAVSADVAASGDIRPQPADDVIDEHLAGAVRAGGAVPKIPGETDVPTSPAR
jgi:hypothetical protein